MIPYKTIRGEWVSLPSLTALVAHKEVIKKIREADEKFEPTRVYSYCALLNGQRDKLAGISYDSNDDNHVILLDSKLSNPFITCEEYKRFKFVNEPTSEWNITHNNKRPSIRNFYEQLISHEYGHLLKDRLNESFKKIDDEAFAFWFSEKVSGYTSLFLSFENEYGKNFDKMFNEYNGLHQRFDSNKLEETLNVVFNQN